MLATDALVVGRGAFRVTVPDLRVAPGARLAVLGPNGSGKSTLLKTLAGLLPPAAGSVQIDEHDMHRAARPLRASLAAYAPPPGELDAPLDVLAMVRLGGAARGLASAETALAALRRLECAELADRPFDRLSTGERQLVALARLLVQDARVCLLDEPTSALDPGRRERFARLLTELRNASRSVVIATHDLPVVETVDFVLWMSPSGRAELSPGPVDPAIWTACYG